MKTPEEVLNEIAMGEVLFEDLRHADLGVLPSLRKYTWEEFEDLCGRLGGKQGGRLIPQPLQSGIWDVGGRLHQSEYSSTNTAQDFMNEFLNPRNVMKFHNIRELRDALHVKFKEWEELNNRWNQDDDDWNPED